MRLLHRNAATVGVGDVDDAEMMQSDLDSVVVEQAEEPELRDEIGLHLLSPLPRESTEQRVVAWVHVAAHADGEMIVEPRITAGT